MQPVLNAPGSMLLKLRRDGPLSNFAFNLNLRRYTKASDTNMADEARLKFRPITAQRETARGGLVGAR